MTGAAAVEAEWALWGKEAQDTEYRLLRCSSGTFGSRDFMFVLDRYSPGTLDELPQVTVSWIRHPETGDPSHLAVAIHETAADDDPHGIAAARSRYDAAGREITFVRYFCVPYEILARRAISYEAMYSAFLRCALPERGREPVTVDLHALPRQQLKGPASGPVRQLADLVAAQLLTTQPVCILGAGQLAVIERLRFIDFVMSLLPYGARSCLSAGTWVNSNFAEHKLRLFFAAAPRQRGGLDEFADGRRKPDDIVVQWGRQDGIRIDDSDAREYLNWPGRTRSWAATALARRTGRVDLRSKHAIRKMVRALPLGPVGELAVPETLECLGEDIRKGDAYSIPLYIENLQRHSADPSLKTERGHYRKIIKYYDLLGPKPPNPPNRGLQDQLYDVLLRLAFDDPLTYEGYLQIEDCLGMPLGKHRTLLAALSRAESADIDISWILVQRGLGRDDNALLSELWQRRVMAVGPAFQLAEDVRQAQPRIRPEHGRQVFDTALQYMLRYGTDRRAEFSRVGYLAPVLDYYYAADQPAQVSRLVQILHNAHGNRLGKGEIRQILGASAYPPTDALLGAVISLAPHHADFAKITYGTARTAGFVATCRSTRSAPGLAARVAQHPKSIVLAVGLSVIAAMMIIIFVLLA